MALSHRFGATGIAMTSWRSTSKVPFDQPASVDIFVHGPPYATGNGLTATSDFHFCVLDITLKGHPRSKVIADSEFLVSNSY